MRTRFRSVARAVARTALVAAAIHTGTGCAWILGIDSGTPLDDAGSRVDAAVADVSAADGAGQVGDASAVDASVDAGRDGSGGSGRPDAQSDGPCTSDPATICGAQTCGQQFDKACNRWVSCGAPCPADGGGNCTPDPVTACGNHCGGATVYDQCNQLIACNDSCSSGSLCYAGSCCVNPCVAGACGTISACGTTFTCAPCPDAGCTPSVCYGTCQDNCGQPCCSSGGPDAAPDVAACLPSSAICDPTGEPCCPGLSCRQALLAAASPAPSSASGSLSTSTASSSGPSSGPLYTWQCQ